MSLSPKEIQEMGLTENQPEMLLFLLQKQLGNSCKAVIEEKGLTPKPALFRITGPKKSVLLCSHDLIFAAEPERFLSKLRECVGVFDDELTPQDDGDFPSDHPKPHYTY
jgi:hypothetical protein